jgi:hypothetical protein
VRKNFYLPSDGVAEIYRLFIKTERKAFAADSESPVLFLLAVEEEE